MVSAGNSAASIIIELWLDQHLAGREPMEKEQKGQDAVSSALLRFHIVHFVLRSFKERGTYKL